MPYMRNIKQKNTPEWWETCEAKASDEFQGCNDTSSIFQVQLSSEGDSSDVFGWFTDQELAERVCNLLNVEFGYVPPE